MSRRLTLALLTAALVGGPAQAAVLTVGQGGDHASLSAAVRAAADGDTIHLNPGSYYECAVLTRRNLVLEGEGTTTVLTDATCEGKALLVARGDGLTIRNLVLARARVPDRNGAGVRLEGQGLTLDSVRFENDEVGVLAGQAGSGTILVRNCVFTGGGVAGDRPSYAMLVGAVDLLRIERSSFEGVKGGQVSTAALRSELAGNMISGGVEPGGGPLVSAAGQLSMTDNTLAIGPNPLPRDAAVLATGPAVTLERNTLRNEGGRPATLLLDWTGTAPRLVGNGIGSGDTLVSQAGLVRHRAGSVARQAVGELRQAAGSVKRAAKAALGQ